MTKFDLPVFLTILRMFCFSGVKANVSEAEHPLLCEGTRRQRGDLAIAMLVHYKDDQVKLSKVCLDSQWKYCVLKI